MPSSDGIASVMPTIVGLLTPGTLVRIRHRAGCGFVRVDEQALGFIIAVVGDLAAGLSRLKYVVLAGYALRECSPFEVAAVDSNTPVPRALQTAYDHHRGLTGAGDDETK
jgi:hypothetical protein